MVLLLAWHQFTFWQAPRIGQDVMALLPTENRSHLLTAANDQLASSATRQVVVAIGADQWETARAAAGTFAARIASSGALIPAAENIDAFTAAVGFYRPSRAGLLTAEQRERLQSSDIDTLAMQAVRRLFSPGPSSGLTSWHEDPMGLWPEWWHARTGAGIQIRDGLLATNQNGRWWAVLRFTSRQSGFSVDGESRIGPLLDLASAAAGATVDDPQLTILRGGVPLHAEAAARQASREIAIIGTGSLLAIMILMWLAFRGPRAILMVSASLLIGTAAGLSVTTLHFGEVQLLTLVFGASLVGVAEDYGIHWFAARQGQPLAAPGALMRRLRPGLLVALVTSVLAYLALGVAPFPGLRQMAVFSAAGLTAAFLTVVLWFPWLDSRPPRPSRLGTSIVSTLQRWPRIRGIRGGAVIAILLAFGAAGMLQLRADDSLRSMHHPSPGLIEQEIALARLLDLPSAAQYFVIEADDAQTLLEREERLTSSLRSRAGTLGINGWQAVSDWMPSQRRQGLDASITLPIENRARQLAAELLEEPAPADVAAIAPSLPADFFANPLADPIRSLWIERDDGGRGSVVMLRGLDETSDLTAIAALGEAIEGVHFVDRTGQLSDLLRHYRGMVAWLLLLGYAVVAAVLLVRYRRAAWRVLLPTALASILSLGLMGWLGEPLYLFVVLSQLLLLGVGIDYGIFLLEHRNDPSSWLAVTIGAASTWLAFGLLGLSTTPALHGFGQTLMLGIPLVWLLAPCFRLPPEHSSQTSTNTSSP